MGGARTRLPHPSPKRNSFVYTLKIDLVYDARHLCTPLRIDGIIKVMSRDISRCKQVIKLANTSNRDRVCLGAFEIIPFPLLNVKWTFRGEGGKAVDAGAGHFWTSHVWSSALYII